VKKVDLTLLERLGRELDNGGEPPDDGHMEERVKKLEELVDKTVERVVNIERDVAVIKSNYATREDISKLGAAMQAEINAQTWKMILWTSSLGTALVGATYFLATHLGK
jgi:hypothetical protein